MLEFCIIVFQVGEDVWVSAVGEGSIFDLPLYHASHFNGILVGEILP